MVEAKDLKRIIEAILFSSSRPVTAKKLQGEMGEFPMTEITGALRELLEEYGRSDRAVEIIEVSGGYQMRTRLEYRDWVKRFVKEKDVGLTRSILETLAVVAYRQPVAKREVDRLRGVDSVRALKQLLDRKLIELAGRSDDPGKPMVFRTTSRFLELFGLKDIRDLPTIKEMEALEK